MADTLYTMLTCNLTTLEDYILDHRFVTYHWTMPKMKAFVNCLHYTKANRKGETSHLHVYNSSAVQVCSHIMAGECRNSDLTALKVVRMNMLITEKILLRDSDVRIIYYVRDPRGMLLSRRPFYRDKPDVTYYALGSRNMCYRMREDLRLVKDLQIRFPHRIFIDKYESLADNSHIVAKRIYQFLGRDVPEAVSEWLKESSVVGSRDKGGVKTGNVQKKLYGTFGKNSTKTASRWKHQLSQENIDLIMTNCREVIQRLSEL